MAKGKTHYGVKVLDLINAGILNAGDEATCEPHKGEQYRGSIGPQGELVFSGVSCRAPSGAGRALAGRSSDGWTDIKVNGRPLAEYRSQFRGESTATRVIPPPSLPIAFAQPQESIRLAGAPVMPVGGFYSLIEELRSLMADVHEARRQTEADTRANFIDRYLGLLGYESRDIRREYHVKDLREYIDYLLYVDGAKSVAVEAKALAVDLTDAMGAQVLKYAAIEDIDWCVLTNGRQFLVYNQHSRGAVSDKVVLQFDLLTGDVEGTLVKLSMLSKESMRQGQLAGHVKDLRIGRAIRDVLLDPESASAKSIRSELKRRFELDVRQDQIAAWLYEILAGR
jgi:hypothetical protein